MLAPTELLSAIDKPVISVESPEIVTGKVSWNWLPNAAEGLDVYQVVKDGARFTVKESPLVTLLPAREVKFNVAEVMFRGVEKPRTTTFRPVPVRVTVRFVSVGARGGSTTVDVGAGVGVASAPETSNRARIVMVPATVPVWKSA